MDSLQEKLPTNAFVLEVKEQMKQNGTYKYVHHPFPAYTLMLCLAHQLKKSNSDSWNESYTRNPFQTAASTSSSNSDSDFPVTTYQGQKEGSRSLKVERNTPSSSSPLQPEPELDAQDSAAGGKSFFFGSTRPASEFGQNDDSELPPLSRDPYAHYETDKSRRRGGAESPRNDDDEYYFFDAPPSDDAAAKPTSWEEIRRRAAGSQPRK